MPSFIFYKKASSTQIRLKGASLLVASKDLYNNHSLSDHEIKMGQMYKITDKGTNITCLPLSPENWNKPKKTQNPEPPNADNEYPCLKVTASQVFPLSEPTGKTVALARCLLNDQLQLTGLRIVIGVNGLFVSYPNDTSYKSDEYKCIYYPVTRALRDHIEEILLAQYKELTQKEG